MTYYLQIGNVKIELNLEEAEIIRNSLPDLRKAMALKKKQHEAKRKFMENQLNFPKVHLN